MIGRAERAGRARFGLAAAALAALLISGGGCSFFDKALDEEPPPAAEAVPEPGGRERLVYDLDIEGVGSDLRALLRESSELVFLKDDPPLTFGRLERRVEKDVETFGKVLRSRGYYAHEITYEIDQKKRPIGIDVRIRTGPLYRLTQYDIVYTGGPPHNVMPRQLDTLDIELGSAAESAKVVRAQGLLQRQLEEIGYPLAKVTDRKAVVDHDRQTMQVTLTVDQGPHVGYGPIAIEGLARVKEDYVRRLVTLPRGKVYDQRQVEEARSRLAATDLFEGIAIEHADAPNAQGNLPLTVRLIERAQRTIGGSVGYSTDEGARAQVHWEHRSLLGRNERLRLSATAAQIEQGVAASFRKPHWKRIDQDLIAEAAAKQRQTDAFDEQSVSASLGLARRWREVWRFSAAVSAEYLILDDDTGKSKFLLLGLPLTAALDTTDSVLDPTEGARLAATLIPYFGTGDRNLTFVSGTLGGSTYYAIDEEARYVAAVRARIGSIVGAKTLDLPANKRFYAGGGGSVRGYAFQTAGPLDANDDPVGGRSLAEIGVEMRLKVTESIGIVPFVDGGYVFNDAFPSKLGDILWAAGIGGRYYTGFGPVRLDVAFPLNKRKSDDFYQFYVSLGQAF